MKKILQPKWIPGLAVAAGIVGYCLRLWLLATGIDEKGLLRTEHPANLGSYLLTVLVLGSIVLCLWRCPGKLPYRGLFPSSKFSALGCCVAAAGIVFTVFEELNQASDIVSWTCAGFGIIAVMSLGVLGMHRLKGTRPNPVLHGAVTLYLMLHLVCQYRNWNAETQLSVHFFQLMASVFLMLSTYQLTALDTGMDALKPYLFFRYTTAFLCLLAMRAQAPVFYLSMALWVVLSGCDFRIFDQTDVMPLPDGARLCIQKLNDAGYDAYAVGGCVRDSILGLTPQDYDLCTNASPRQISAVFHRYRQIHNGEKHGTIGVVIGDEVYEITTFRTEGDYSDSRHPDWVKFVNDVRADLARRDFTVNAMAYSPVCGYVDPFGGRRDLEERVLRTVGDPTQRFTEDALRILRGVRFAARYRLTPHPETEAAMSALAHTMDTLAQERIFAELCKLLEWATAEDLVRYAPIITHVLPELAPTVDFQQHSPHHSYDVYTHTAHVVENTPAELPLRWAALLHDAGKPETFTLDENGCGHFYGHASASALLADTVLQRLRAPNALREQVVFLVEQHMLFPELDKKQMRRRLSKFGTQRIKQLLQLQKADFCSKGDDTQTQYFAQLDALIDGITAENACLSIRDLKVDGNDLIALGFQPGPALGQALEMLLEMVLDERVPNEKYALIAIIKEEKL